MRRTYCVSVSPYLSLCRLCMSSLNRPGNSQGVSTSQSYISDCAMHRLTSSICSHLDHPCVPSATQNIGDAKCHNSIIERRFGLRSACLLATRGVRCATTGEIKPELTTPSEFGVAGKTLLLLHLLHLHTPDYFRYHLVSCSAGGPNDWFLAKTSKSNIYIQISS